MSLCEPLQWPVFTVCHGFINVLLFCLTGLRENRRHPATYLVHGAKALNNAFRSWTRKEVDKIFFDYFTTFLLFIMLLFPNICHIGCYFFFLFLFRQYPNSNIWTTRTTGKCLHYIKSKFYIKHYIATKSKKW